MSLATPAGLDRLAECEGLHGCLPGFILLHDVSPYGANPSTQDTHWLLAARALY